MRVSAPRLLVDGRLTGPGAVDVSAGRIVAVHDRPVGAAGPDDVQLATGMLVPGLVDLQVNGAFGCDLAEAAAHEWQAVARSLPATGVTSWQPTLITAPLERLEQGLAVARAVADAADPSGARMLGVHLEGPFLSPARAGVHDVAQMCDPEPAAITRLLEAGGGLVTMVTLAPERPGGIDAVATLAQAGVCVSVGHSDATADVVAAAADAGARAVTHVFNAQRGLHHREPGVAGRALVDERLAVGLIADLHHVSADVCRLVLTAACGRVVLVTDAMAAAGMPDGDYLLGGQQVHVRRGRPPQRADGTIAGSALLLDQAVRNVVGLGVPVQQALDAASRVPADALRRPDLGRLAPGAMADLLWLSDDLVPLRTWVAGREVWSAARS